MENKLSAQELQAAATRAVSQVLLSSTGVLEMNGSSSELPSSRASEANPDFMLEAMAQPRIPTDLMRSHLESTLWDIVDTIVRNMDMLSSTG